jgi:hypothetical protein
MEVRLETRTPDHERPLRVLILGGYGTFGSRLARLLADEPRLTLIVAGRSLEKARGLVARLRGSVAGLEAVRFDRDGDVVAGLRRLAPDLVVDCSGPFQAYGGDADRVVRAAIGAGAHYLDLADAPDFVRGIGALDAEAKRAGVFALSGASTVPALTAAVVRRLAEDLPQIDSIAGGIASSPKVWMGKSVIGAVVSCAGRPVARLKDGARSTGVGLVDSRVVVVAPPGVVPLPWVRFSLVDVPDLTLLPEIFPGVREVWFGAGLRPRPLHRVLNAAAWMAGWGLLPPLRLFAPVMHLAHAVLRWGEHRSGMFVRVEGRDHNGAPRTLTWHVLAEGDHGPFIPAMAAAALIRRLRAGDPPPPGARPATDDVTLADYEPQFAARAISTGVRDETAEADLARPLYARVLGAAFDALPAPIRAMHDGVAAGEGRARVERGRGPLARLIAGLLGFPEAGDDVPVRVEFTVANGAETWTRRFAGRRFASVQRAGQGRDAGLILERFGPLEFLLALVVEDQNPLGGDAVTPADRENAASASATTPPQPRRGGGDAPRALRLVVRGWRAFGVAMPRFLAPIGDAHEHADDGRFHFHVELKHPLAGLIVRYRGWLAPAAVEGTQRLGVSEALMTP